MVTDIADALRATSDALLRDLDVLTSIEEQKRALAPGDTRLIDLSARIEEIARRVLAGSTHELKLSETAAQAASGAEAARGTPIAETPRAIASILADWRDAERRLVAASPGSGEAAEAKARAERLREEYGEAFEAARHVNGGGPESD